MTQAPPSPAAASGATTRAVHPAATGWRRRRNAAITLALILLLAACLRLYNLIPVSRGLQALQDYDEAVWDSTAQLMLQGHVPYRDFFATLPPVGIYLLAAALRVVYVPWGSGVGLMATRYASVVYGLLTVWLVCLVGRKLAGRAAGLLAAGLLAVDGLVIGMDRLAMLEPPLNLLSVLAVLVYLSIGDQAIKSRRAGGMAVLAGVLAAVASLTKTPGLVMVAALVTVSLLRRRFAEGLLIAVGFGGAWLVLTAYFLRVCGSDFVKQVYLFQFLRPPDGVINRLARLYDIWHYGGAWLSVRLGLGGCLLIGVLSMLRRSARPWWVVLAWAGYTGLLIMVNGSYYPQYYVQLAVPLCLLGGGLLDSRLWRLNRVFLKPGVGLLTAGVIVSFGLVSRQAWQQPAEISRLLTYRDATYVEMADRIRGTSAPDASVLVFEPNYTFLSSRAPAGAQSGRFLVDSYGEMLYANLGIGDRPVRELAQVMLSANKGDLQSTFWRPTAQEQVLAAFERADSVVIDGRARYQLQPDTLAAITAHSAEVFTIGVASLHERHGVSD